MSSRKLPVHPIFAGIEFVLALVTLIPTASASKPCFLGYRAHCSFTPISTAMLLALVGVHVVVHRRSAVQKAG
jgi:hypothetical protein